MYALIFNSNIWRKIEILEEILKKKKKLIKKSNLGMILEEKNIPNLIMDS